MPIVINYYSSVVWAQIISGYAGVILVGAAMLSVGLLCSTVTDKQIIAAVLTIGILVMFWFVGGVLGSASVEVTRILRVLSLYAHFSALTDGLLDLRDMVYLISFASAALFIGYRVLDSARWKG
jgi:ABC-2 type transport system permease protein